MTPAQSWVAVLIAVAGTFTLTAAIVRLITARPDPDRLIGELAESWMRHPSNHPRCACGAWCVRYANILDGPATDPMLHTPERCQPRREQLEET